MRRIGIDMSVLESYLLLFVDSLYAGLAISPKDEIIFYSMTTFGLYNKFLIFLTVVLASTFAIIFNYYFGRIICNILSNFENSKAAQERAYVRNSVKEFYVKYHMLFLMISVWPFAGKFVQLLAGIFKVNLRSVLLICIGIKVLYYGFLLLS